MGVIREVIRRAVKIVKQKKNKINVWELRGNLVGKLKEKEKLTVESSESDENQLVN